MGYFPNRTSGGTALQGTKEPVRTVITAALASYNYSNKVITDAGNGAIGAVDGLTLQANDRVLVSGETAGNAKYNDIYVVTAVCDGPNPFVLTRASDNDVSSEMPAGLKR